MSNAQPWYKHRWPWILMAGPAAVIVAGGITMWLAFAGRDGLVAEDYYRQGLAINKVLAKEEAARRLGISAELVLEGRTIRIRLQGEAPEAVYLHLVHATRAGNDARMRLARTGPGLYEGAMPPMPPGRWRAVIEDSQGRWRIVKEAA
jgi:uncharacterized protein